MPRPYGRARTAHYSGRYNAKILISLSQNGLRDRRGAGSFKPAVRRILRYQTSRSAASDVPLE